MKIFIKVFAGCFLLLVFLNVCAPAALAGMNFSRRMQGTDRKVTELLLLSMQARDAGDMANAELFWMHARELRPSLKRPAWLQIQYESPANISDNEVLDRIARLPYGKAKILLEEQIRKSPANQILRSRYLELARENNDEQEVKRHASAMKTDGSAETSSGQLVLRYVIFLILSVLLVWQLAAFVNDIRSRRSEDD